MSSGSGEHGRMGSLKAVVELCIFGPSLFGYMATIVFNKDHCSCNKDHLNLFQRLEFLISTQLLFPKSVT